jgi:hypothetical protein
MINLIVQALVLGEPTTLVLEGRSIEVTVSDTLSESRGYAAFSSSFGTPTTYRLTLDKEFVDSYKSNKDPVVRGLVAHELGHILSGRLTDGITNEIFKDEEVANCWAMQILSENKDEEAIAAFYEFLSRHSDDESDGYPGGKTQMSQLDRCNPKKIVGQN